MIHLKEEGLDALACEHLKLVEKESNIDFFVDLVDRIKNIKKEVTVALVGKYVALKDAYLSVVEALNHAGYNHKVKVKIDWIDASNINENTVDDILKNAQGIIVPGGFGERGIKGKLQAIQYARENKIPFLGLCLGMQLSVIEFARNVCGLKEANSTEFNPNTPHNVIDFMPDQYQGIDIGGTLRLGRFDCHLEKDSLAYHIYNKDLIQERHRHRYEFNNDYKKQLEEQGMVFSGIHPQMNLVEVIELKDHPFFIAVQYHPEFLSRPDKAHPLFDSFIKNIS
jgi:CTP synthase